MPCCPCCFSPALTLSCIRGECPGPWPDQPPPPPAASCSPCAEPAASPLGPLLPRPRIPQSVRILGSLIAILLVFLITAVLVKVHLDAVPFFVITMIKIMLINCKQGWEQA